MKKALILIVDRSEATRAMYADYLRHHGYAVAQAEDSAEGLQLCAELAPDLVVTELSADWEWVQAIRVMRRDNAGHETVVIACSTHIDPRWPQVPDGIQVDGALPKPASPRTLLREVQLLLGHLPLAEAVA